MTTNTNTPATGNPNNFDNSHDDYAAGWDSAVWCTETIENLATEGLANTFGQHADEFERLAEADELQHPESAAYKAGAAYGYRQAQAALLEFIAARRSGSRARR
ncbi:hypothetical protein SEA_COEUR_24 [Gordonia phage Coeur]|uniref:Uncharacterized protein n=1 Tax=Gordonia phage Coeur TaxID=2571246 RepID=A0A4Y6EJA4_9CAUD|nr:hypothetical protein PQC60_gp24 [Gordonia phage Coeur]QDF17441.1 hypothetical protein SEA_COEUR_24 [Gordonia phage Coeur]